MVDPHGWIQSVTPQLRGISRVIVLGCGPGEHLAKLATIFPPSKIMVIEKNMENVKQCRRRFAIEMTEVKFLVPRTPVDLLTSFTEAVCEFVKHSYTIARYAPVTAGDPGFYDEVEGIISGRTQISFSAILKYRPDFSALFERPPELSRVYNVNESRISIKNLISVLSPQSQQQEGLLVRALGELIA